MRSSASPTFLSSEQSAAAAFAGAQAVRCAAAGGAAAGLVSSKTSGLPFLEVGFARKLVLERRVKRLRRQVWAAGHLHRFRTPKGTRENVWFVTLTYRGVDDWQPRHISKCLKAARVWCQRHGQVFRYIWVAELQQRGALHYHLAIWLPKRLQLVLRVLSSRTPDLLAIAGRDVQVAGCKLRLDRPHFRELRPHATLYAYKVASAGNGELAFMETMDQELARLSIRGERVCGKRSQMVVAGQVLETFSLMLHALTPDQSLRLQQFGLGPHRLLGCGVFVPHKSAAAV